MIPAEPTPLNYLDIGARGGLAAEWRILEFAGKVAPIYVEADADAAANFKKGVRVLSAALGSTDVTTAELNVTSNPYYSSILKPLVDEWPDNLQVGCEIVERRPLSVTRLDTVWPTEYGDPHFVKIDTQGYELEVLRGFGDLLDRVLCAEVEVRIAEQYEDQPLASDVYKFMKANGFDLVGFKSNGLQAGRAMMVFNAFFVRTAASQGAPARLWRTVNNIGSAERVRAFGY